MRTSQIADGGAPIAVQMDPHNPWILQIPRLPRAGTLAGARLGGRDDVKLTPMDLLIKYH